MTKKTTEEKRNDIWKEEIARIDKEILEDLRYNAVYHRKQLMKQYNIPEPPAKLDDYDFIDYVDNYITANFVIH